MIMIIITFLIVITTALLLVGRICDALARSKASQQLQEEHRKAYEARQSNGAGNGKR